MKHHTAVIAAALILGAGSSALASLSAPEALLGDHESHKTLSGEVPDSALFLTGASKPVTTGRSSLPAGSTVTAVRSLAVPNGAETKTVRLNADGVSPGLSTTAADAAQHQEATQSTGASTFSSQGFFFDSADIFGSGSRMSTMSSTGIRMLSGDSTGGSTGEGIITIINPTPVPLPPALLLMGSGLVGLAGIRRRHIA